MEELFQFEHKGEETDERRSPPTRINSKTKTETSPRNLFLQFFPKFHEEKSGPSGAALLSTITCGQLVDECCVPPSRWAI